MDFSCALLALKTGRKIRRAWWNDGAFIFLLNKDVYSSTGNYYPYFNIEDVLSGDWEVLVEH
jgi:hypothetical protein